MSDEKLVEAKAGDVLLEVGGVRFTAPQDGQYVVLSSSGPSEPKGTYYGPDYTAELAATRARVAEAVALLTLAQGALAATCDISITADKIGVFLARERAAKEQPPAALATGKGHP